MATAKKITELAAANSVANTDLLIVEVNPSTSSVTKKITMKNLLSSMSNNIAGPYDTDVAAAAGNVAVRSFYYNSSGVVKIRLT